MIYYVHVGAVAGRGGSEDCTKISTIKGLTFPVANVIIYSELRKGRY